MELPVSRPVQPPCTPFHAWREKGRRKRRAACSASCRMPVEEGDAFSMNMAGKISAWSRLAALSGLFASVFLFFSALAGIQGFFQGGKPFSVAQSHHQESRHHFQQGKEDEEAGSVECGYFLLAEEGEEGAAGQEGQITLPWISEEPGRRRKCSRKGYRRAGYCFSAFSRPVSTQGPA